MSPTDTECSALLGLLADIRAAVGDPTGKLMQDELVEHCRNIYSEAKFRADGEWQRANEAEAAVRRLLDQVELMKQAGDELARIIELPATADWREWVTDTEIDAALNRWRDL